MVCGVGKLLLKGKRSGVNSHNVELHLFDPMSYEDRELAEIRDEESRARKLRLRNEYFLRVRRIHPASGLPLSSSGLTCGDCRFLTWHETSAGRRYYKCKLGSFTHGEKTDIRLKWQACVAIEKAVDEVSAYPLAGPRR